MPLYAAGRYAEALARIEQAAPELPTFRADTAFMAACLRSLAGDPDGALAELQAAIGAGAWWAESILREDPDLAAVQGLAGFDALVAESARRWRAAAETRPLAPLITEPQREARGVLVVLHGANQDAATAAPHWSTAVDSGLVLMAVTSRQRTTPSYRSWPDQATTAVDIAAALGDLDRSTGLPVIAAGFSAGGRAAMLWAVTADPVPVAGYLVLGPAISTGQLPANPEPVPGIVVYGSNDGLLTDGRAVADRLGSTCRLEVVSGLGHDYPPDFAEQLKRSLDELLAASSR